MSSSLQQHRCFFGPIMEGSTLGSRFMDVPIIPSLSGSFAVSRENECLEDCIMWKIILVIVILQSFLLYHPKMLGCTVQTCLENMVGCLGSIAMIAVLIPWFLLCVPPFVLVLFYLQRRYVVVSRELKRLDGVSRSPMYAHFSETLQVCLPCVSFCRDRIFISIHTHTCMKIYSCVRIPVTLDIYISSM